jgi:hypothetical protein
VTIAGGFGDDDGCDGGGDHEALELRAGRSPRGNCNHVDNVNVRDGRQRYVERFQRKKARQETRTRTDQFLKALSMIPTVPCTAGLINSSVVGASR